LQYKDPKPLADFFQNWSFSDAEKAEKVAGMIIEDQCTAGNYSEVEALTKLLQQEFSVEFLKMAACEMQSERGFNRSWSCNTG